MTFFHFISFLLLKKQQQQQQQQQADTQTSKHTRAHTCINKFCLNSFFLSRINPFQFGAQCRNFSAKFATWRWGPFRFQHHSPVLAFNFIGICRHADIFTYAHLYVTKYEKGNECESGRGGERFLLNIYVLTHAHAHTRTHSHSHTWIDRKEFSARRVVF